MSLDTQEQVARRRIPPTAVVRIYKDSGGHNSGYSTGRPEYQRMLADLRRGELVGIAAYDQSRLNRNAENDLALLRECVSRGVRLLVDDASEMLSTPTGKLTYGMKSVVSEHYRNEQSERMKAMFVRTFEQGGHRGADPFGYRTARDDLGRVRHPRTLEAIPEEAQVVRRAFLELRERPFASISDAFNEEGFRRPAPGPWTADAIKAIWSKRLLYAGNVVLGRRHRDPRPGTHAPIITEDELREATAGVEARKRGRTARRTARRFYLLSGLLHCSCGARMRGDARVARGREYRYMACPVADGRGRWLGPDGDELSCSERRVRAEEAERQVLEVVGTLVLPEEAIDLAREQLRERLRVPAPGLSDRQRSSLKLRLEKLKDLYVWDAITAEEYQSKREELERQLTLLPDHDKLVTFDHHRQVLVSMGANIDTATPARRRELLGMLIERVVASGQEIQEIVWAPAARPFFGADTAVLGGDGDVRVSARPEGLEPPTL